MDQITAFERNRIRRAFTENIKIVRVCSRQGMKVYTVLGTRFDIYTVSLGGTFSCTCPDFLNGHVCKHLYYCCFYLFNIKLSDVYAVNVTSPNKARNSECIICYESLDSDVSVCRHCRNGYHGKCILHWLETNSTCPVCRKDGFTTVSPIVHMLSKR